MNKELLEILACPICRGNFTLENFSVDKENIVDGILQCNGCKEYYPIYQGVPRMVPNQSHPEFFQKYDLELKQFVSSDKMEEIEKIINMTKRTNKSFSIEWGMYEYGEKTWGLSIEEREGIFLYELGYSRDNIAEKVILDAGCGNGALTSQIGSLGAIMVGMDLSDSVVRAYAQNPYKNVHFLQGNVLLPPFREGIFDCIYSSGVLHHTGDTKGAFKKLVPLLKSKSRFYVLLYKRRSKLYHFLVDSIIRRVTTNIPLKILKILCYLFAAPIEITLRIFTRIGIRPQRKRPFNDRALSLFDEFSVEFKHHHTPEEVIDWYQEEGFSRIEEISYKIDYPDNKRLEKLLDNYRMDKLRLGFSIVGYKGY